MNKKNCHKFKKKKLAGDEHYRNVCQLCGYIDYGSPQVVAGSIVTYKNKFLLCKRGIHPGYGLWTLPSGFVEKNESVEMGAMREAKEEACIKIKIKNIFGIYSIKKRNIIQIIFLSRISSSLCKPGIESLDVKLFKYSEIPWKKLAFPSVKWALKRFKDYKKGKKLPFLGND